MNANEISDEEAAKNAPFRSARRARRKQRVSVKGGSSRRLTIRADQRDEPDVRKIARAVISIAMLEAEREAQALAEEHQALPSQEPADE
jgi:hypothetical protein